LKEAGNEEAAKDALFFRCATDLALFAAYYFPHYCQHPFNEFHRDYFGDFQFGERKVRRARGAPRGYAKSTVAALIKPIHDLCYGLERFVVIFSNGESQALGKLRDIRNELLSNPRLVADYRIRFARKNVAEGSFEVSAGDHSCKFEAYGSGSQVRGIRHGAARPSKIILDDVEHSEEVENEAIRQKYFNWYQEDVIKIGDENTNVEFIGTVLHKRALLKDLLDNPMYDSQLYKAVISWATRQDLWDQWQKILTDLELPKEERLAKSDAFYAANREQMLLGTKVLWPEKEPYLALMKELVEGGRRAFWKEKQNEPLGGDDKVFTRFHWYRETEQKDQHGNLVKGLLIESSGVFVPLSICRAYGTMDPATGQTKARAGKKGDFTCLVTGLTDPKGRLFVHRDWTRRAPPTEYIGQIFLHHDEHQYEKFGVETNLYRNLLMPNIVAARKVIEDERKKTIRLPLYDIENVENKEKRIYTLEPKITNGYILLNRALSPEFFNQLDDFPKADHDDCPDALEMLWGMVNNRYKMTPVGVDAMRGR
jgi:predicted phage terminase large subunit-like protein